MKRKTIGMLISSVTLAATTLVVAPIVMTSCSALGEKASNPLKLKVEVIDKKLDPTPGLLSKTANGWAQSYRNNPSELLDEIKKANYKELSEFDFDNAQIVNIGVSPSFEEPTKSNLEVKINNYSKKQSVQFTIQNLNSVTSIGFEKPTSFNLTFNQLDLDSIANLDPKDISDAAWTEAINATNTTAAVIPYNLYSLTKKEYNPSNAQQYLLTYEINNEYSSQLGNSVDEYKPINVTIELSPYLNKEPKFEFNLSANDVSTYLGESLDSYDELVSNTNNSDGQKTLYNALQNYVNSLKTIQPLRECINSETGLLYNFNIMPEDVLGGCKITFSTNPNSSTQEVYNYTFKLVFPNSNSSGSVGNIQ